MTIAGSNLNRREFLRAAVCIGGSSAFSACLEREQPPEQDVGRRPDDLPSGQHMWNDHLKLSSKNVPIVPQHHLVLMLDYRGDVPTDDERQEVEQALRTLERAYDWSNDGILFTVGYSPYYFDIFDRQQQDIVPEPVSVSPYDDPVLDEYDVSIHLASDYASNILGAEETLFNNVDELNSVEVTGGLEDVFSKRERRTGFMGEGLPAQNQDVEGIPDSEPVHEEAPAYMGFETNLGTNQAGEQQITGEIAGFESSTTQHVSKLSLDLEDWYSESLDERVSRMFETTTTPVNTGETGEKVEESRRFIDNTEKHAKEDGMIAHAEKTARARKDDNPLLLRRDFNTTDGGEAGVHFVSLQRNIADFIETRTLMNGVEFEQYDGIGEKENNGILEHIEVERRANFLVPGRSQRSLPTL